MKIKKKKYENNKKIDETYLKKALYVDPLVLLKILKHAETR